MLLRFFPFKWRSSFQGTVFHYFTKVAAAIHSSMDRVFFKKSIRIHELRIYNVFDMYLKGIESIRNSSCSHSFDEWLFFYYKRTIKTTHSFKFTMFLQSKSSSKEIS